MKGNMLLLDDLSSLLQKIKQYLLFAKASFLCQLSTLLLFSFTLRYKHSFVPAWCSCGHKHYSPIIQPNTAGKERAQAM